MDLRELLRTKHKLFKIYTNYLSFMKSNEFVPSEVFQIQDFEKIEKNRYFLIKSTKGKNTLLTLFCVENFKNSKLSPTLQNFMKTIKLCIKKTIKKKTLEGLEFNVICNFKKNLKQRTKINLEETMKFTDINFIHFNNFMIDLNKEKKLLLIEKNPVMNDIEKMILPTKMPMIDENDIVCIWKKAKVGDIIKIKFTIDGIKMSTLFRKVIKSEQYE